MSKSGKKKILVLVEGARTDVVVMEKLFTIYNMDLEYQIVSYCTNIYTLYKEMFCDGPDGFYALDILQVLKSREKDIDKKKIFDEKYTDIILIFDLDPHDTIFKKEHILLMQEYFCESSDMGKLYLNYPMIEAFYHLKSIPDLSYFERKVFMEELKKRTYKLRVNNETKGRDYNKFILTKEDCNNVILQNISKANFIMSSEIIDISNNELLSKDIDLLLVLIKQLDYLDNEVYIYVLCTCVLFISEYNPNLLLQI
jgi:hypothetical protein